MPLLTKLAAAIGAICLVHVGEPNAAQSAPVSAAKAALGEQHRLKPASCRHLNSIQKAWVPETWARFEPFVRVCPVARGKNIAFWVMSVWADSFYNSLPPEAPAVDLPKPLLISKSGAAIGEIPMNYPSDPPRSVDLIFSKWSADFPREIRIWVEDPAVLGSRYLPPLIWNAESGRFATRSTSEGRP